MLLGKPGAIVTLPALTGQVKASYDIGESQQELLAGGVTVDYAGGDAKTRWTITWDGLGADDAGVLHAYATRQRGRGPWAMYLPETRHNVLSPNTASCGDALSSTDGWSTPAGAGETIDDSAAQSRLAGGRSLLWSLPSSVAVGELLVAAPFPDWFGFPTDVGRVWSFGAWVFRGAGDTTFDTRVGLRWYDIAGAVLSTTVSTYTATAAAWAARTVTGTAPASAAYVRPLVQVDATDVSTAATVHVDDAHLEIASSIVSTLPGGGMPRVSIVAPARDFPVAEWSNVQLVFQEV